MMDEVEFARDLGGYFFSDNLYLFDGEYFASLDGEKMEGCHREENVTSYSQFILENGWGCNADIWAQRHDFGQGFSEYAYSVRDTQGLNIPGNVLAMYLKLYLPTVVN